MYMWLLLCPTALRHAFLEQTFVDHSDIVGFIARQMLPIYRLLINTSISTWPQFFVRDVRQRVPR